MELQVASTSLRWSQSSCSYSPSCSKTMPSGFYSPSSRRLSFFGRDRALFCQYAETSMLSFGVSKFSRSRSCKRAHSSFSKIRKSLSGVILDQFSDHDFEKRKDEFARMFEGNGSAFSGEAMFQHHLKLLDEANSFSVGSVTRRNILEEAGEIAYCSVKKAFSSMVFIIHELHSFTLQMREALFLEDLQGILGNVHKEIQASFVWLFEKVFSHTPTLMIYVMILLADYSVHSMSTKTAIAAMLPAQPHALTKEEIITVEDQHIKSKLDGKFTLLSSSSKMTSTEANVADGGGGKFKPLGIGTNGDDRFDQSSNHQTFTPDDESLLGNNLSRATNEESASSSKEEKLWESILGESSKIQQESSVLHVDHDAPQQFISPVDAKIEFNDYPEYFRTDLHYQMCLSAEPNNPLFLANYAQFLFLVAQDFDRAEGYFKRAIEIEPKDADTLNKYAKFQWLVKKDIWAAEETFLESIAADNNNSFYASDYAHFLWSTGGEDTCFPLDSPASANDEA